MLTSFLDCGVLITGVTGFVGGAVARRICADTSGSCQVRGALRRSQYDLPEGVSSVSVTDIDGRTDWRHAVKGVHVVIHCAGRAHIMNESADDPLTEFRRVNAEGTLNLANQAAHAGVRRFIFLSSVKVNGEATSPGRPFRAEDLPAPEDAYGISKREGEDGLRTLCQATGMEFVVVRAPLIYGPGVKANFRSMMGWIARQVPLPLGGIRYNRRSLIALDNLVDLLIVCVIHPRAAGQTFLISDDEDLSTTELLCRTAKAMGKDPRLFAVPPKLIQFCAQFLGQGRVAQRLCGTLQVDISKTRETLDWTPPISVDEGLRRAAIDFLSSSQTT